MMRSIWLDQVVSSDPALTRLWSTTTTIVSMGLIFLAEWLLVRETKAFGATTRLEHLGSSALTVNHEITILAILVGGTLSLMLGLAFDESDVKGTIIASVLPAFPLLLTTLAILLLGSHRTIGVVLTPLLLGTGTLFRKYGSRGNTVGPMMYVGGFFGYELGSQFGLRAFGWLTLEVGVAIAILILGRLIALGLTSRSNLERAIRSYSTRAQLLTQFAIESLLYPSRAASNRLHKHMIRLNEMALIIEAYMSKEKNLELASAMRQTLFDLELSLSNLARFADSVVVLGLPSLVTRDIVDYIRAIPDSNCSEFQSEVRSSLSRWRTFSSDSLTFIMIGRLSESIINLNNATQTWRIRTSMTETTHEGEQKEMSHVTLLRSGQLPGSAQVSARASTEPWEKSSKSLVGLTPSVRIALQITFATSVATAVGYAVNQQRFYWASLSAMLCFMGVNNAGEQVWKGLYRFVGTVIGVILGSVLTKAIGLNPALDAITVLVALFLGIYLSRINYTFLATGVTVAISMAFFQLSELSSTLLLIRVIETTIGALVASLTALFVLPLSPKRVITTARIKFLTDLNELITAAVTSLASDDKSIGDELLGWSREVDADFQAFMAAVKPLQWSLLGSLNRDVAELISRTTAVRNYTRTLMEDMRGPSSLPLEATVKISKAGRKMVESVTSLINAGDSKTPAPYTRISYALEEIRSETGNGQGGMILSKLDLILRDLTLLDGSLATLSETLHVPVRSLEATQKANSI